MNDLFDIDVPKIRIKRERKRYFRHQILLWIGLISLEIFCSYSMLKLYVAHNAIPDYFWIPGVVFLVILLYMSVFLFPGQGDLILTPEGLSIHYFYKLWPDYRWDEFLGFYEVHRSKKNNNPYRLAGELKKSVHWNKRILFPRFYETSPQELVAILNQWKEKYSLNQSEIEFSLEPRIYENSSLKYLDFLTYSKDLEFILEPVIKMLFYIIVGLCRLVIAFFH